MFSTLPRKKFNFSVTFILSSASVFNLDQSKNLLFGKELYLNPTFNNLVETAFQKPCGKRKKSRFLYTSLLSFILPGQFDAFSNNKIKLVKMKNLVLDRVENIVEKGENADYQHFLLFAQCFQKASLLKVRIVLKTVHLLPHNATF